MAVTVSAITAAEEAALDAGKMLLVGTNALRRYLAVPVWSSSGDWADSGTTGAGSNLVDTAFPTRYLYDDVLYNYTQPSVDADGLSTVYLLLDLDAGTDDDQTIDVAWWKPIGFDTLPGNVTVTLEFADNAGFSTNLRTICEWTGLTSAKAVDVRIGDDYLLGVANTPPRFTNVRYARLKIETDSAFTSAKLPQIAELVLGRRRQLGHLPRAPWDPDAEDSAVDWFASDTEGVVGGDVRYRGRFTGTLNFRPTSSTMLGVDETAALHGWWADTDSGTRPFLLVDDPTSGTTDRHSPQGNGKFVYAPNPRSIMPYLAQYQSVREASLELIELPPFQSSE